MPVVNFILDLLNDNVQLEMDDVENVIAEYENEPGHYGEANNQTRDGVTSTFHYDGHGSTRALTDESQDVTDTMSSSLSSGLHQTFVFGFVGGNFPENSQR